MKKKEQISFRHILKTLPSIHFSGGGHMDFDVIVIGSGFGGAITSCRLAEKGKKVLVLERGKKWDRTTYPRKPEDDWLWSHADPEHYCRWPDLRRFEGRAGRSWPPVGRRCR